MSTLIESAKNAAIKIFEDTKNELKEEAIQLAKEDLDVIELCAKKAAELGMRAAAGEDVTEMFNWITFTLAGITHIKANKARRIFWQKVNSVVTKGTQVAVTLLVAAI